jgi:hypothetical protein
MKCIKNLESGEIRRVENKEAFNRVGFGWTFVPRSEWKEKVRGEVSEQTPKKGKKVKEELV